LMSLIISIEPTQTQSGRPLITILNNNNTLQNF
jgi:hypothetical protein